MTEWKMAIVMRHIPEDELHAYLDQALSRSQCVEIECHLADCRACQMERNRVAAIRDRTTALLAGVAPRRVAIPPFESLVERHQVRRAARGAWIARIRRVGLLAAGLTGAIGAGWWSRGWLGDETSATTTAATPEPLARVAVVTDQVPPPPPPVLSAVAASGRPQTPEPRALGRSLIRVNRDTMASPDGVQVATVGGEEAQSFDGMWQTVDLQQATAEMGGTLPRIDGLPILEIQLQRSAGDERPTVVVYQQHPSGRILRTVEGPMDRVQELVAKHSTRNTSLHASQPDLTPPDYLGEGTANPRRVLRVVTVTGSMPVDSLNLIAKTIAARE